MCLTGAQAREEAVGITRQEDRLEGVERAMLRT